jgi:serine/threonine-protein kinase
MPPANDPGEANLVGTVLSRRYLLKQAIGVGGMGAVYAAEPLGGGAPVAVKILHSHFLGDDLVMSRFLEEGRTCMRLVHPNILRVHECLANDDGRPYLVMDLLEGVPLEAYTKDGGRIALDRAIPIVRGMLAGLEGAHSFGVVHRDLKPANVFLARAGGVFDVKLLDFGIAKVMDAAGRMGTRTKTGALLGTPAYMSPEQVRNSKDVDARSDLWSVGVMFWEMLSGRVAFPAPTEYARLAMVLSEQPAPIQSVDPELAPVACFMERALEKDRDRRFQTAREMAEALTTIGSPSAVMRTAEPAAPAVVSAKVREAPAASFVNPSTRRSSWPVKIDMPAAPLPVRQGPPAGLAGTGPRDMPGAPVFGMVDGGTLSSPAPGALRGASPSAHPPAPVVVVSEAELATARARQAAAHPDGARDQAVGRMATPLVAALIAIAFTLGFVLGVVVGHGR